MTTLTVYSKGRPIEFETELEWEQAIVILNNAQTVNFSQFVADLLQRDKMRRFMSESQCSWVYKLAEDANPNKKKVAVTVTVDASNIIASLTEAKVNGLKWPTLRLSLSGGSEVAVKFCSTRRNIGGAWVSNGAKQLVGKINDCGEFTIVGDVSAEKADELRELIASANADVSAAISSYGHLTSRCGCCGLPLTNKVSIALGIGPICAGKFGL